MRNIKRGNSSIAGEIKEGTPFVKVKDFVGIYDEGALLVKGIIKTHSDAYNRDTYSLYIERAKLIPGIDEPTMLMNVPEWYGSEILADFNQSRQTAEEYFNTSIQEIKEVKTKYNTTTYEVVVFE